MQLFLSGPVPPVFFSKSGLGQGQKIVEREVGLKKEAQLRD